MANNVKENEMPGPQSSWCRIPAVAVVVLAAVASGPAVAALVLLGGPAREAWASAAERHSTADQRLAATVVLTSWVLLGVLGCWLSACVAVEVWQQVRTHRAAGRPAPGSSWRPDALRSLVALLLGSALTVPLVATADPRPALPSALDGLPLPDRVVGGRQPVPVGQGDHGLSRALDRRPPTTLRVRPGDTLWWLAAGRLPASSSPAAVDRAWRRLYAANETTVGPDPDLLIPGTRLRVPRPL